jgi:hypothetical protein
MPNDVKRFFIAVIVVLVALAMIPLSGLTGSVGQAHAADPIVLTVYSKLDPTGPAIVAKEYTQASLAAIATTPAERLGYLATSSAVGGNWQVYGTNHYVEFFNLLKDSGVKTGTDTGELGSGYMAELSGSTGSETFVFQDYNSTRNFYPGTGSDTTVTAGAYEVPPVIAINSSLPTDITTTAAGALSTANLNARENVNQYLFGYKETQYLGQESVKSFVDQVTTITVIEPNPANSLDVYLNDDSGDPVYTLSRSELEGIATKVATPSALGYLAYRSSWTVHGTYKYIPLDYLIAYGTLGLATIDDVEELTWEASDGYRRPFSGDEVRDIKYFYPDTQSGTTSLGGATIVSAVLALEWQSQDITGGDFAQETLDAIATEGDWTQTLRFYIGLNEDEYEGLNAPGNRFPTAPVKLIIETY